jgi:DMSO/TMAO reductase YedYZ molybdopterin-dependent catalytic subunit
LASGSPVTAGARWAWVSSWPGRIGRGGGSVAPVTDLEQRLSEELARLRAGWADRIAASPARADSAPQGEGPANRHGMPREPPGQNVFEVHEWPVLDIGQTPKISLERWRLTIDGAVATPLSLSWADFQALPQVDDAQDFHCVTGWSILDMVFRGVRFETLAALARLAPAATHVMCHAADGYSTNLPLEEALKPDVLLAHELEGKPLDVEHGGPVRMVVPELWAWKGAKWINRLEFLTQDRRGYWEIRGYSNTAHPWRDDRMW